METNIEKILELVERMQEGAKARLEAKLRERKARLVGMAPVNENIKLGSLLFQKGPLYWNAITVEENGERMDYRISEYLEGRQYMPPK